MQLGIGHTDNIARRDLSITNLDGEKRGVNTEVSPVQAYPLGAIAGGFIIAFSEVTVTYAYKKFLTYILPSEWAPESLVQLLSTDYKFAVTFAILVLVLLLRPTGVFGAKAS